MPLARCRCCDETNYRRLPHRGLAPRGAMPWASHKNRRRQEGEFSIIFLPRSRCPMSEMSAEVDPSVGPPTKFHSPHALVIPTGRPRSSSSREDGVNGLSDRRSFLQHFWIVESSWPILGRWFGWPQSYACMTALPSSTLQVRR